jgi:hypothetical protein
MQFSTCPPVIWLATTQEGTTGPPHLDPPVRQFWASSSPIVQSDCFILGELPNGTSSRTAQLGCPPSDGAPGTIMKTSGPHAKR